jgi:hypothetical protein
MSFCSCCDERLLLSIEPCNCSGNYCDRCIRCAVHCSCEPGRPFAEPLLTGRSDCRPEPGASSQPVTLQPEAAHGE